MFAIIRTGGKQYKVGKNDTLRVEKLDASVGASIDLEVMMIGDEKGSKMGADSAGSVVSAEIVDHIKGDKVIIFKKKRRHNYRRKNGHRQHHTVLKITDIKAA